MMISVTFKKCTVHVCFLCVESETRHDDGRVLSVHSEHIWHHSVCSVCMGCRHGWLVGIVLHCSYVLHLCKCCFLTVDKVGAIILLSFKFFKIF